MQSTAINPHEQEVPRWIEDATAVCDGCRCRFEPEAVKAYPETPTCEAGTFCADCAPDDAPSVHVFQMARVHALRIAA